MRIFLISIAVLLLNSCGSKERLYTPSFNSNLEYKADGYSADYLGKDFIKRHIILKDDFDGPAIATLVMRVVPANSDTAVLYIHGYSDYFFQTELSERVQGANMTFYALDLRRYGRSKLPHQIWYDVRSISDYFEEIDSSINIIRRDGYNNIVLMAHSTGGLTASLYAASKKDDLPVVSLVLNSPFFDFNMNGFNESVGVPIISMLGKLFPNMVVNQKVSPVNCMSMHKSYYGEWNFDTIMKPVKSPLVTASWVRAIHKGQKQLQKGIKIACPVLIMTSGSSSKGMTFRKEHLDSDTVLDVEDIQNFSKKIEGKTDLMIFPNGLHDLVLSRKEVRDKVYSSMFKWIKEVS